MCSRRKRSEPLPIHVGSVTGDGDDVVKKGPTFRVHDDGTPERISSGAYVDALMTALCVAQVRQQIALERSPVTASNVPRREAGSTPFDLNTGNTRLPFEDKITPTFSERGMMLERTQPDDQNSSYLIQ